MCEHSKIIEKVQMMRYYQRRYQQTKQHYYFERMRIHERLVDCFIPLIDLNENIDPQLSEDELKLLSLFAKEGV